MLISDWSSDVCSSDLVRPPAAEAGTRHQRTAADVRRGLAVDAQRVLAVSTLQAGSRRGRRIQRQVHVRPVRAARRLLRDTRRSHPADLSKFLSTPCALRSEEHTSELQSLMRTSYAVFRLKQKKTNTNP